jgi:FKBP-type peptidyl-prolyl cis-trans isomerase
VPDPWRGRGSRLIHETTYLPDGRIQFSTRAQGRPLRFLLGGRQVIDGVDEAVTGMRVGEQRRLVVAPHLSRRSSYPAGLSPNDTLHYELELVAIESPQEPAHRSR